MDSQTIVELFGAKLEGQQLLFEDHDYMLRNTKFKVYPNECVETNQEILIHWWMHVYVPDGYTHEQKTEYEIYKTWSNALWHNFKYVMPEGYCQDTHQSSIRLACRKHIPLAPQLKELELWLPHMKEITDENGRGDRKAKYVSIFEHTLSKGACFSLSVYSETEITLNALSYSHHRVLQKFDSLAAAVDYVRLHHWYESENEEDQRSEEDDEDDDY